MLFLKLCHRNSNIDRNKRKLQLRDTRDLNAFSYKLMKIFQEKSYVSSTSYIQIDIFIVQMLVHKMDIVYYARVCVYSVCDQILNVNWILSNWVMIQYRLFLFCLSLFSSSSFCFFFCVIHDLSISLLATSLFLDKISNFLWLLLDSSSFGQFAISLSNIINVVDSILLLLFFSLFDGSRLILFLC